VSVRLEARCLLCAISLLLRGELGHPSGTLNTFRVGIATFRARSEFGKSDVPPDPAAQGQRHAGSVGEEKRELG
jgi:hypothetical protein